MGDLVFALLDTSDRFADTAAADRARELSLGFTRFKFRGPIIENADPDLLLRQAAQTGARCCVFQPYGCFLQETWVPGDHEHQGLVEALSKWPDSNDYLAAGALLESPENTNPATPPFLLVDLERYRRQSNPAYETVARSAADTELPDVIARNVVRLEGLENEPWMTATRQLSESLQRAVFVWNIEPYDDIESPADPFEPPLKALYTVAAGFKPNRILHIHGATPETRMLVFDYSEKSLGFRRQLHEDWNGADYPSFLRRLLRRLPPSEAHYLLWQGTDPERPDWDLIEARWQQEVDAWGGGDILQEHWRMFRKMKLDYVHCDLLRHRERLIGKIADEPGSLIWWSNVFLTVHSIWNYPAAHRQRIYEAWIRRLAEKAPQLNVIGADCNNLSISGITAGQYADWLKRSSGNPLDIRVPRAPGRIEMRY